MATFTSELSNCNGNHMVPKSYNIHYLAFFFFFFKLLTLRILEKEMAIHSNILAWKIPWMEEPGRLQSMGLQRVGHDFQLCSRQFLYLTQRIDKGPFLPKLPFLLCHFLLLLIPLFSPCPPILLLVLPQSSILLIQGLDACCSISLRCCSFRFW